MSNKKIILNFLDKKYFIDGDMTLDEFKKYMISMEREDAIMIGKSIRKDVNEYLNLVPKRERKITEKPVKPIGPIIDTEEIDWKKEALNWKEKYLEEKQKREKLEVEFNEFKLEVKALIFDLKTQIKNQALEISELRKENQILKENVFSLNQKVSYYDKKYNNEYDRKNNHQIGGR